MSRHILASLHIGFDRPTKGLAWKTKSLVLLALNQEVGATLEPDGGKRLFEHMNELGFAGTEKVEGEELLLAIHVAIQNSDGCVPFCIIEKYSKPANCYGRGRGFESLRARHSFSN